MRVRRTVSLPKAVDKVVQDRAALDGSYSAALARLIEEGDRALRGGRVPAWIGRGHAPPVGDVEKYLRRALRRPR